MNNIKDTWQNCFQEAEAQLQTFKKDPTQLEKCSEFSKILIEAFKNGGTAFTCGNGGSHCDAMHFAEELTGKYQKDRRPLPALALGDASHVTCVGNDYGFKFVFSRPIEAFGRKGDVLIGLSTSGNSENVIMALQSARAKGLKTSAHLS